MARDRPPEAGMSGLPFDDARSLIGHFPEADQAAAARTSARLVPLGDAGVLVAWLAGWRDPVAGFNRLQIDMFISLVNAGRSDVDENALGAAQDLLARVAGGGHGVAQVALAHGAGLKVYDLALEAPTGDITTGPAMEERECAAAMAFGMEGIAGGPDIVAVARGGAGGDVAAAAILSLLYPDLADEVMASLSGEAADLARRAAVTHEGAAHDPFELLRRLGSRDMAAVAGVIMAARTQRIPVVIAGLEGLAVATLLARAGEDNLSHCLAAHNGGVLEAELVRRLGLKVAIAGDWGGEPGVAVAAALGHARTAVAAASALLRSDDEGGGNA